jgi:hypothetical protein
MLSPEWVGTLTWEKFCIWWEMSNKAKSLSPSHSTLPGASELYLSEWKGAIFIISTLNLVMLVFNQYLIRLNNSKSGMRKYNKTLGYVFSTVVFKWGRWE